MISLDTTKKIRLIVKNHHEFRGSCLNLGASENVSSPSLREIVMSDLMHRYSEWEENKIDIRWNPGSEYIIQAEKITTELAQKLFDAKFVDVRPVSGQTAVLAAISALTKPGTKVFECSMDVGGHGWCAYAAGSRWDSSILGEWVGGNDLINYTPDFFPFSIEEFDIDVDASMKKIRKEKPSLLILGSSYILFPQPVEELKEAADEVGANVLYDGAHVTGLIAGKMWPNPLMRGAIALTSSTHKTIPGPQRGLAMTNDGEVIEKIGTALYPPFITNHHPMNSAALAIALAELIDFGEDYAKQIIKNAKALGAALSEEGFKIIGETKGYTESHQVLPLVKDPCSKAVKILEKAGIITNMMDFTEANGLRIGTAEVTRVGMEESEMIEVARFIRRALMDHEDPEMIFKDVKEFTSGYQTLKYSVDHGKEAYKVYQL